MVTKLVLVDAYLNWAQEAKGKRLAREPIGLLEMGAYLRSKIPDLKVEYETVREENETDLVRKLIEGNSDYIGFSTYTYNYPFLKDVAKRIKRKKPHIKIIFGGPHAVSVAEESQWKSWTDYVVIGEGEVPMCRIISDEDKNAGIKSIEKVSLDGPFADRLEHLLYNPNISGIPQEFDKVASILSSRGCNRTCDFCISQRTGLSYRSIDRVTEEMIYLQRNYGVNVFLFEDPLFNASIKRIYEICESIIKAKEKKKLTEPFYSLVACDFVFGKNFEDIFRLMKKAEFSVISWGIEDPRQNIRDQLNKKVKLSSEILTAAKRQGIFNRGLLMIPTDIEGQSTPEEEVRNYLNSLSYLPLDEVKINILTPFPGTPLYERLRVEGRLTNTDWRAYTTNELVFKCGSWTQGAIDWARDKIVNEFQRLKWL